MKTQKFNPNSVFRKLSWLLIVCFLFASHVYSQDLLLGGNMENDTCWNIYNLGSANPATYEFNYTAIRPVYGKNGCLHVTSLLKTNILFWQKVKLKAGKSYVVDGAVKTNNVASFWCELYLSIVIPTEGTDYSPNSNGDVVLGFSTWSGCGPNTDGTFSENGCSGKRIYKVPGTNNEDVEVYFALKTGSMASPLPNPLEVFIDELSLKMIKDSTLLSTQDGKIDTVNFKIKNVSPFLTVEKFHAGLHVAPTASVDIISKLDSAAILKQDSTIISDSMAVKVVGSNGTTIYPIELRTLSGGNRIVFTSLGKIGRRCQELEGIPFNVKVIQLKSAITVSKHATFDILDRDDQPVPDLSPLEHHLKIVVTAENGNKKTYKIETERRLMLPKILSNFKDTVTAIRNKILILKGQSELYITNSEKPLEGSLIDLKSEDVWIYFPNIKPSVFNEKYLPQILVKDSVAMVDKNIRLVQYLQGTVIISQSSDYKPLEAFVGENLSGTSQKFGQYTYYRSAELASLNDSIKSFKLKKGYMATFAKDELGTGYSRVYVASDSDIVINKLPVGLYNDVSLVRVIPWRWVSKKGWTSGPSSAEALNCSWNYDWNNVGNSALNVEYIPMRHNKNWNSYENINNKQNSTHALGFNEPDRPDQANMTVSEAIAQWPELLKSGLRLGSPSPSDGGLEWLYQFIDRCDALNYRVDFVAMHYYQGGQSPKQFYDRLKSIHDRTKRPIWITEWNNGANWTCCKPTYAQQAAAIAGFIKMLDTTSFVERYSLYEWVEDTRHMFYKNPTLLTPAGEVYRDKKSPMAFDQKGAFYHDYVVPPIPPTEYIGAGIGFDYGKSLAVDIDNDGNLDIVYSGCDPYSGGILKNDGNGNFTNTNQSLQGLYIPSINAGDLDGDGDMDVIISGWDKAHGWPSYARILRNDGTGIFTQETPASVNSPVAGFADLDNNGLLDYFMIGNGNNNKFYFQNDSGFAAPVNRVSNGSNIGDPDATWVDIDKDQDVDFCIEAYNKTTSKRYTQLWKNKGDGTFTEQTNAFKQKHWGSAQFADIDNDGDIDMLLNGDGDSNSDAGSSDIYRLYLNDGNGQFTEGANFQKYRQNCNGKGSAFVDWDNDGDYDIVLTGYSSSEGKEVTNIYLNDGNGVFTKSVESLNIPGINKGTIEIGDFNNDGKIDLLLNGYSTIYGRNVAFLFKNTNIGVNTKPIAPGTLQTTVTGDSVSFKWNQGSDAETKVNGLTYNMYVKDASGRYQISPNANVSTGKRLVAGMGNAYNNLGWNLKRLPAGTYKWSVQTLDASYTGSNFAPEATFIIGDTTSNLKSAAAKMESKITNNSSIGIYIYPNPVKSAIYFKNLSGTCHVFIYDMEGQLMAAKDINGNNPLNVESLREGMYTLKIVGAEVNMVTKFIKK